jgi:hypothetical protein
MMQLNRGMLVLLLCSRQWKPVIAIFMAYVYGGLYNGREWIDIL